MGNDGQRPENINHMSQMVLYLHLIFTAAFHTFMFHLQLHLTAGLFSGYDMKTNSHKGLSRLGHTALHDFIFLLQ